tara:strand:+ start:2264 stop:3226 length:963 start_codon:yes stop_codon:yes gene_type:complete
MSLSFSNFELNLEKNFFCEKKPKIAVAVSGGPDSLALCMLLNKWISKKKGNILALIVDHRIRSESYYESINTKNFLINNGIKCEILFIKKSKVKEGKPVQARVNRFEKILKFCKRKNLFYLFLGHHSDDNLETFVLRKIAGSNFEGLNSINFLNIYDNVQLIRPLIYYSKKEILLFNKKHNIPYINDPTNQNTNQTRVAIRKYLSFNKDKKNKINKEFNLIRENYILYKKMIFQLFILITIEVKLNKIVLNSKKFLNLNNEIKEVILIKSIKFIHDLNFKIRSKAIKTLISNIVINNNISQKTNKTLIISNPENIIITKV